jgi:hypothetical protein
LQVQGHAQAAILMHNKMSVPTHSDALCLLCLEIWAHALDWLEVPAVQVAGQEGQANSASKDREVPGEGHLHSSRPMQQQCTTSAWPRGKSKIMLLLLQCCYGIGHRIAVAL